MLDLFCGAGGCSVGYVRAGFEVIGVDISAHPDYPYELIVKDALRVLDHIPTDVYFVHASPPCQAYTTMSNRWRGTGGVTDTRVPLIHLVRGLLQQWGGPYVIENVPGARKHMRNPVTVTGGAFGLKVHRPRLFESNLPIHGISAPVPVDTIGVYGKLDGRRLWTHKDGTELRCAKTLEQGRRAMGIDWMSWEDLTEAVPPAYTDFIGRQVIDYLTRKDVAA